MPTTNAAATPAAPTTREPTLDDLSALYWGRVKAELRRHGFDLAPGDEWDDATDAAVMAFKGRLGLRHDRSLIGAMTRAGLVGPALPTVKSPHPWLDYMIEHLGLVEIPGANDNQLIVAWGRQAGIDWWNNDDDAWCAVAVNAALVNTGFPSTKSALARSFCAYGTRCDLKPGAIVVFPRGSNPTYGHVAVVEKVLPDGKIQCVNGNVGNAMRRTVYSVGAILPGAIRWPVAA